MDLLKEMFQGLSDLYTQQRELAAIWLEKPLQLGTERTCRIAPGMLVKVVDEKLVDYNYKATHKVIACFGTMYNQFELTLIDLSNNQPLQIKL